VKYAKEVRIIKVDPEIVLNKVGGIGTLIELRDEIARVVEE
jgi:hypothetical protein